MASSPATPQAPYAVSLLTIEDAMDIAMWRMPGPWAVQDSLEPPPPDEGFWAVRDVAARLVGYCCFGEGARLPGLAHSPGKLDVALGMGPQYAGRKLSHQFAEAVVAHARSIGENRVLRCAVPSWNAKGRHTSEAAGFHLVGSHEVKGGRSTTTFFIYEL